jgi:hypothetical protein
MAKEEKVDCIMKYMVVVWDVDRMKWHIKHWSHNYDDAKEQLTLVQAKNPNCLTKVMVDIHDIEDRSNNEFFAKLLKALWDAA